RASEVTVALERLQGPGKSEIRSKKASGDGVFDYVGRPIELFYVRYLPILGLSLTAYSNYDERHVPKRLQRPYSGAGAGKGLWKDRPDHERAYPEIAVPLELVRSFHVQSGWNQSIWVDIQIPKNAKTGVYRGTLQVREKGMPAREVPVELEVKDFALPDVPAAKTMLYLGYPDLGERYVGVKWPNPGTEEEKKLQLVRDRHFQLAHRHRISLVDADNGAGPWKKDQPRPEWIPRLDGSLFTPEHGYEGPGEGVGNGVYSVGTYGSWSWKTEPAVAIHRHGEGWERWFAEHFPGVERFLYLVDESTNYPQTEAWAKALGSGALRSFATINLLDALAHAPSVDIATTTFSVGEAAKWQKALHEWKSRPGREFFLYNAHRPSSGTFATEDDGVALRELAWAQYKMGVDWWFYWESTYYNDYQSGRGQTDVYESAQTFGTNSKADPSLGRSGWNYANGDGVLFYPGTDQLFPSSSYEVAGPIASLRLKHWRRGIQDVDYLTLAAKIDPLATRKIVERLVPKALWEYGIGDAKDPTWVRTDVSWSSNPDDWEKARAELAGIILGKKR
ncbi:MAG: glycoside hydrolase domain-containing protein, partial [Bdellovibrionota bacterium]